jgi:hypothetical protein
MEYVVVAYPTKRTVRIDGEDAGFTNETLRVERGHHLFDLGLPLDYRQFSVEKTVQNTTIIDPLVIDEFHPV